MQTVFQKLFMSAERNTRIISITVKNIDNRYHDQWNLADSLNPSISRIFFGDFDHDRFREIYIFSYKGDSLFLNVNEILQPSGTRNRQNIHYQNRVI